MSNILDPSALLSSLPGLLPGSPPKLCSPQDGLVALTHSIMSALEFRLIAIDDESSPQQVDANVLPEEWNKHGPGSYTLRYRHNQSSLEYIIKASKLGGRTLFNAIANETDKIATLDISTNDFVSPSFFPHDLNASGAPLVHGFISSNRVADFVSQYTLKIVQNVLPGLHKEGYEAESAGSSTTTSDNRRNQAGIHGPTTPSSQEPPEDPSRPSRLLSHIPPANPLQIGRRDLDPIAFQNQPNPFAPLPLFPPSSGDGMFVGPDHPIFSGRTRGPNSGLDNIPGRGPWGGDGFLPPMGAPPGARFDPVGPWQSSGPFRGPRGTRSGDPDNDEFMPPHGSDDMFS